MGGGEEKLRHAARRAAHAGGQERRKRGATHLTSKGKRRKKLSDYPHPAGRAKDPQTKAKGRPRETLTRDEKQGLMGRLRMVGGTSILTQCPEPETCQANTHNGQAPRTLGAQGGTPVPPSLPILSLLSSPPPHPRPSPAPIHPHWPEHRHVGLDTFNGRMLRTRRPFPESGGAVWGGMSSFRCPVMTIPPPQPGPSGSSSPGVLPSSSLPSPNTPGPEFQINRTDTNACTQLYALMRTHSDVHEEGQACAETHCRSPGGKQKHWTSLENTGPHSQTHRFEEREVQRETATQ